MIHPKGPLYGCGPLGWCDIPWQHVEGLSFILGTFRAQLHKTEGRMPESRAKSLHECFGLIGFDPGVDGGGSLDGGGLGPGHGLTGVILLGWNNPDAVLPGNNVFYQGLSHL